MHEMPNSISIYESSCKVVYGQDTVEFAFGECCVFDTNLVRCYDNDVVQNEEVVVVDYFNFENMKKNKNLKTIITNEDLVSEIQFVAASNKSNTEHWAKGCLAITHCVRMDLQNFEYSDTMVRFKLQEIIKTNGYKGKLSGVYSDGSPKYSRPNLKHIDREVRPAGFSYRDSKLVKFMKIEVEDILDDFD